MNVLSQIEYYPMFVRSSDSSIKKMHTIKQKYSTKKHQKNEIKITKSLQKSSMN